MGILRTYVVRTKILFILFVSVCEKKKMMNFFVCCKVLHA